ncbi:hypothetical protein HK101_000900 [Irineochytrium annulatum]|nr:hypothetical protein HK101_000900 [Irineochytrium annulatum]
MDLSRVLIAAAPYAGPVAIIRNDRKLMTLHNQSVKPVLHIYTGAGGLLYQIPWEKGGRIVGMGWSNTEHLVCVTESGVVRVFSLQGDCVQFSLGSDAKDYGVIDCKFWDNGLVALLGNYRAVSVSDYDEPRPKAMVDMGLTQAPTSWSIIAPQHSLSRHLEMLVSVGPTILVADASNVQDQFLHQGPFISMCVSPNGKYLALFTAAGRLWVVSTDFQKSLAEFSTNSTSPPLQITWCGTDSVVLVWDETILVVGPFGEWIKYTIDSPVHLVTEIDGVRIICRLHRISAFFDRGPASDKSFFLEKVPAPVEDVFKIGSTTPGAILYDAYDHFERKSARADENVRNIRSQLTEAVNTCLEAAAYETDQYRQRMCLKAASFGKSFLISYNAERFVKMCKTIRILNALRHFDVGIPLTFAQFVRLTPDVVVNRLVNRHLHLLALRISDYLQLNRDRVMVHWACAKLKKITGDGEETFQEIVQKLGGSGSDVSYSEVAKAAYQSGHTKLATHLLDFEPRAGNQVPLLLSMEQDDRALLKAIESGDTDLVYSVILHLKRKHPLAEFFRIIHGKSLAMDLVEVYAKQQDMQLLKDFYYQDDRRVERANVILYESFEQNQVDPRLSKLREALKLYQEDKDRVFEYKAVEDQMALLKIQSKLEKETGHSFFDMSISQTIFKLLLLGHFDRAKKMKSDLKVPEKRFLWLKLKALIEQRNWDGLDKFVKESSKQLSVGNIVESLIKADEYTQAKRNN